nr:hypothetical protein BgiMline_007746 [Biomphalaria glabrata]
MELLKAFKKKKNSEDTNYKVENRHALVSTYDQKDGTVIIEIEAPGLLEGKSKQSPKNGKVYVDILHRGQGLSVKVSVKDVSRRVKTNYFKNVKKLPSPVENFELDKSDWHVKKNKVVLKLLKKPPHESWLQKLQMRGLEQDTSSSSSSDSD